MKEKNIEVDLPSPQIPQDQIIRQIIREELRDLLGSDRYLFQKHLQLFDGRNIQIGRTTGTKFGTGTDQKIGFYNKTPIIRQATITAPTGGATIDTQARSSVNEIKAFLTLIGLTA